MATINDIVLVYYEGEPFFFARIEDINPDHKKDWYHVKLLVLQVPVQTITWILRDAYINGDEFTMEGKRVRLEKVESPEEKMPVQQPPDDSGKTPDTSEKGTVISFRPGKPEKK